MNMSNFNTRQSLLHQKAVSPDGPPYIKHNKKSGWSDPDKHVQSKRISNHVEELKKESMFFQKYACICHGTMSLEVVMWNSVFKPYRNIEMEFDLNKVFKNLQVIQVSLLLELKIWSLKDPRILVEHIS